MNKNRPKESLYGKKFDQVKGKIVNNLDKKGYLEDERFINIDKNLNFLGK